jgi:hypothetical protein
MPPDQLPILDRIPTPDEVRARLAQLARERYLLRSFLRLANQKVEAMERERQQQRPAQGLSGGPSHAA